MTAGVSGAVYAWCEPHLPSCARYECYACPKAEVTQIKLLPGTVHRQFLLLDATNIGQRLNRQSCSVMCPETLCDGLRSIVQSHVNVAPH